MCTFADTQSHSVCDSAYTVTHTHTVVVCTHKVTVTHIGGGGVCVCVSVVSVCVHSHTQSQCLRVHSRSHTVTVCAHSQTHSGGGGGVIWIWVRLVNIIGLHDAGFDDFGFRGGVVLVFGHCEVQNLIRGADSPPRLRFAPTDTREGEPGPHKGDPEAAGWRVGFVSLRNGKIRSGTQNDMEILFYILENIQTIISFQLYTEFYRFATRRRQRATPLLLNRPRTIPYVALSSTSPRRGPRCTRCTRGLGEKGEFSSIQRQ